MRQEGKLQRLVFTQEDGTPIQHYHIRTYWTHWLREAKLPYIRFHDLRHTAATWLIAQGVAVNIVQQMLGHANPATTMRFYAHVMQTGGDQAMRTMTRLMQEAMAEAEQEEEKEAQ
jgi:integrase